MKVLAIASIAALFLALSIARAEPELVGHWKLESDGRDASGSGLDARVHDVTFADGAAWFDGRKSFLEVPDHPTLDLGTDDFSLCAWVHTEKALDDVLGDIASKFDPESRTGFNFGIQNLAGVTSAQPNFRHVAFGIDAGRLDTSWTDRGRPGNCQFIFALCAHEGDLYAGTFESGADESGHVYRYVGGTDWIDCGSPDRSNAVESLAVYEGKLYAGACRYLASGSALPESPNERPGGTVWRYEGGTDWTACGKLANPETGDSFTVGGLAVYKGELYAGVSKPPGKGLYRFEGGTKWTYCGHPGYRVTNPVVYNGNLYCCSLDGGGIARYDGGANWTDVGTPAGVTQTYGFAIYRGELYASSWPNGEVFRYDGRKPVLGAGRGRGTQGARAQPAPFARSLTLVRGANSPKGWLSVGRLGNEKEVMGMAVYNGMLYAGTLPLAEVYRYDGGTRWRSTGQLDTTPLVRYRRAWSMAVYRGELYCGTLPSGHVFSIEAGKNVTHESALPAGWAHLAAVRAGKKLRLYVAGQEVAESTPSDKCFHLSNDQPLLIGFGASDYFNGRLRDVRLYRGAMGAADLRRIGAKVSPSPLHGAEERYGSGAASGP